MHVNHVDRNELLTKCREKGWRRSRDTGTIDFAKEFQKFFPRFPMNVIEQWPYRHFDSFVGLYCWDIGYERLEFRKDCLSIDDFKRIGVYGMTNEKILSVGEAHLADEEFVATYIREHRTFPNPIIVLDSTHSDLSGEYSFKKPYHLLEGHRRTWLLRALIETGDSEIPERHDVWMVTRK